MSFTRYPSQQNDIRDSMRRGTWGELAYVDGAGASLTINGTGTVDTEVPLLNMGYAFNLAPGANAELVMLSLGTDVNDKVALATLPRDMQHPWAVGTGGVQHPMDPERRLEFNAEETWLKDGVYVLGDNKELRITISGGEITLTASANLTIAAPTVEITGDLTNNGVSIGSTHTHSGVNIGLADTGAPT